MDGGSVINVALFLLIVIGTSISLMKSKKMSSEARYLWLLSLASTVFISVVPKVGYNVDGYGHYYFGLFTDFMVYRGDWMLTFDIIGLLVNFFLFYLLFKVLLWIWRMFTKKVEA